MKVGLRIARVRAFLLRHFPERQIYHRRRGSVDFYVLSTRTQVAFVVLTVSFLGWIAYASVNTLFHHQIVAALEDRMASMKSTHESEVSRMRLDFDELNAMLALAEERFGTKTGELEGRQAHLESAFDQKQAMDAAFTTIEDRVQSYSGFNVPGGYVAPDGATDSHEGEEAPVEETPVADTPVENAPAAAETPVPSETLRALKPAPQDQESSLEIDDATSEFREAALKRGPIGRQLITLDGRMATLTSDQTALAERLQHSLQQRIDDVAGILTLAGMEPSHVEELAPEDTDQGGPFISLADATSVASLAPAQTGVLSADLLRLTEGMGQLDTLQAALMATPLALPLDTRPALSSGFGRRHDPFSRRWAFHAGLDFRGDYGTPVHVTAPGVVVTAERKGPYGNFVEVDHGFGMKTRYGHLQAIKVVVGQELAFGDVVGLLGSTGRSTGPHLHYEVWYDGKARDPLTFLRAGQYVFER